MPHTSDKSSMPRVSIKLSNPDEIHIVDINTARQIRDEITKQIQQHEENSVMSQMLNSVTTLF